jgi:large subunit ribosomal protein L10
MKASLANAAALFQAPLTQIARTADALRAKVEQEQGGAAAAGE